MSMTHLSFAAVVKARCAESALQQGPHVPFARVRHRTCSSSIVRACFGESDDWTLECLDLFRGSRMFAAATQDSNTRQRKHY